jgi:hypothetical protein
MKLRLRKYLKTGKANNITLKHIKIKNLRIDFYKKTVIPKNHTVINLLYHN